MAEVTTASFYTSQFGISYSDASALNTVDVHLPKDPPEANDGIWAIFIHGGGWRDAKQSSRDLVPALAYLPPAEHKITGVASINYRLSAHPEQPAESGSADERARTATHPTHVEDVRTALAFLQQRYGIKRYVLSGHSAGATLSFQAVMGRWGVPSADADGLQLPEGIIGICGIYDLTALAEYRPDIPLFKQVIVGAFGDDPERWKTASPVAGEFARHWPNGRAVVLAASNEDELISKNQAEAMSKHLETQQTSTRRDAVIQINGLHDQVYREGKDIAGPIKKCLDMLSTV